MDKSYRGTSNKVKRGRNVILTLLLSDKTQRDHGVQWYNEHGAGFQ
jgi:hypothetical protein